MWSCVMVEMVFQWLPEGFIVHSKRSMTAWIEFGIVLANDKPIQPNVAGAMYARSTLCRALISNSSPTDREDAHVSYAVISLYSTNAIHYSLVSENALIIIG